MITLTLWEAILSVDPYVNPLVTEKKNVIIRKNQFSFKNGLGFSTNKALAKTKKPNINLAKTSTNIYQSFDPLYLELYFPIVSHVLKYNGNNIN